MTARDRNVRTFSLTFVFVVLVGPSTGCFFSAPTQAPVTTTTTTTPSPELFFRRVCQNNATGINICAATCDTTAGYINVSFDVYPTTDQCQANLPLYDNCIRDANINQGSHISCRPFSTRFVTNRALTSSDITSIVNKINTIRGGSAPYLLTPPASSIMAQMTWNYDLQHMATRFAAQCDWNLTPGTNENNIPANNWWAVGTTKWTSENFSSSATVLDAIENWYNQHVYFDYGYGLNQEGKDVGSYVQLVWNETTNVGCAQVICDGLDGNANGRYYVVCMFGPAGGSPDRFAFPYVASSFDANLLTTRRQSNPSSTSQPTTGSICGHSMYFYSSNNPGSGIIGGVELRQNEYPWLVRAKAFLYRNSIYYPQHQCVATIIHKNWFLTSAKCIANMDAIAVYLADHNVNQGSAGGDTGELSYDIFPVNHYIHPLYNEVTGAYDYALLNLNADISFSDWKIQKICLPSDCTLDICTTPGRIGYVAGWGHTNFTKPSIYPNETITRDPARIPWKYEAPLADSSICEGEYNRHTGMAKPENTFCVGDIPSGGASACTGDEGAPYMVISGGAFYQCGVFSRSLNGCGTTRGISSIFGSVCQVRDWIRQTTGGV